MSEVKPFAGKVLFSNNGQISMEPGPIPAPALNEADEATTKRIASAIKAYLEKAREICSGPFAQHGDAFPDHFRSPSNAYFFVCSDGLVVRYDRTTEETSRRFAVRPDADLAAVLPLVSGGFVFAARNGTVLGSPENAGLQFTMTACKAGGVPAPVSEPARAFCVVNLDLTSTASSRPRPLASVTSAVTTRLLVQELDESGEVPVQGVWVQQKARMPLSWSCIEVYPLESLSLDWSPEAAAQWADEDVKANWLKYHVERSQLLALDPVADARRGFAALFAELEALLTRPAPEQELHQFLKKTPHILCHDHVRMWSKLPFGKAVSDFVFRRADGSYQLVEIERPDVGLFRKSDGQPAEPLTHAIYQTEQWLLFLAEQTHYARDVLGLDGILGVAPRVIVMGRSRDLTTDNRKQLAAMTQDRHLSIITYDDMVASAKTTFERVVGPLWAASANGTVYYQRVEGA